MIFRSLEGKLQEGGFLKDMQKIWILQVQNLKSCFSTFSCAKCAGSALTTVVWMPNVELTEKKNYRIKFEVEASFSSGMHSISIGENLFDIPPNIWHDQMKESANFLIFSTLCPAFVQNQDFMFFKVYVEHVFVFQDELSCYSQTLRTLQWSWKQDFPDCKISTIYYILSSRKKILNC